MKEWIAKAHGLGASDVHFEAGTPVVARIQGELAVIGDVITEAQLSQTARELMGPEVWAQFPQRGSADVSMTVDAARCRISFYRTIRGLGMAVRLLEPSVSNLHACNLHEDLLQLIKARSGLVVISGRTGS